MIPVTVLTGFLGSGKTTVLGTLLRRPEFSRTAVIINEFGEVGLDHELIETSDESFIELQTGCLCCKLRGDIANTLDELLARRDTGAVAPFERIMIETSGLADPAPILQVLMTDAGLAERTRLAGVVTTVDAVNGARTLDTQAESVKQVAVADRLLLTKTDLAGEGAGALMARLAALNPVAPVLVATNGGVDPAALFDDAGAAAPMAERAARWLGAEALPHHHHHAHAHAHDAPGSGIACFALVRSEPLPAVALTLFLEALADHCGGDLLRLKGIVGIAEMPERPAVVHGVQHVFHAPAWLERWPSQDRTSRLVFFTRGLPRRWIEALLAAIEAEVGELARAG